MLLCKLYSIAFLQPGRADLNLESGTCLSSALKCGRVGGAVCTPPPSLPTPALPPSASHPSLSHQPHNSPPLDRRVFTSFPSYQQIKGSKAIFSPQRNRMWNPSERACVAGEGRGPRREQVGQTSGWQPILFTLGSPAQPLSCWYLQSPTDHQSTILEPYKPFLNTCLETLAEVRGPPGACLTVARDGAEPTGTCSTVRPLVPPRPDDTALKRR